MRYGMVIDLKRCAGCNSCTVACRAEKGTPPGILYHRVEKYEAGKYPAARMQFRPIPCMHCEEPACLEVCPTGATYKRADGIVLVDHNKCMGCRYCVLACPYEARHYLRRINNYYGIAGKTPYEMVKQKDLDKGTAVKCDFCVERLEKGRLPACVETCPSQARHFGDLDDPRSEVSELIAVNRGTVLREELGTKPSVYYING
ncbi:MAG TPA: 4Fe-4S dicluster domain-containing protein [Syntrophorhabdales bacterium]|nr:4Fe-4S dicluster domain-containing protein [Syntrophorhabdales bacterium]